MTLKYCALGCLLWACQPTTQVPGDEVMGQFALRATPAERACQLVEMTDAGFEFNATLSRRSNDGMAWLTLGTATVRAAEWNGQVFSSTALARRVFASRCSACSTALEETLRLALVSRSQGQALQNDCPEHPFDGGVPLDVDAGIVAPQMTPQGFDAVRACGELTATVRSSGLPDGGPCDTVCEVCTVRYQVSGERR